MKTKLIIYRTPDKKVGCLPISENDWKEFIIKEEYVYWVNSLLGLTDSKTVTLLGSLTLKNFKELPKPIIVSGSYRYRNAKYNYETTRTVFKNAYKPWTEKTDKKLEKLFWKYYGSYYLQPKEVSILLTLFFKRTQRAIECRLQHLNLYEQ